MDEIPKLTKSTGLSVSKALQKAGKSTSGALAKTTGRTQRSVQDALKILHRQSKIHVGDFELNRRGKASKVWFWGDGDDKLESSIEEDFTPRPDIAAAWMFNV